MRISLVTDEVSADPETAIELGLEWGVENFELRGFGTKRVPVLSTFQADRLLELREEFGVSFIAISPGLFKCPYPLGARERFPLRTFDYDLHTRWRQARDLVQYHMQELLPQSIEFAGRIGAGIIVLFGFHRGSETAGEAPDEVLEALQRAAESAHEAGLQMAVEVEEGFWADTGARTAEIIRALDHPAIGVNWDPGNAIVAGETPYPEGYEAVRGSVFHVHFKDVLLPSEGEPRYAVEGAIDWPGQIRALARDRYEGYISVETHMRPKVQSARAMIRRLQQFIEEATSPHD